MTRVGNIRVLLLGVTLGLLASAALAAEPVAVLTEIHGAASEVQAKRAGETTWKAAQPLLALRPGDQILASGSSRVVLVFAGGRGAQVVTAANSPFTVAVPAGEPLGERLGAVVGSATNFLMGKQKDLEHVPIQVRQTDPPRMTILSPRETRVLTGSVTFEWAGPENLRYRVRVMSPSGLLWEAGDVPRRPIEYPRAAPAMTPGTKYSWQLDAPGRPVQQAGFEILRADEAERVKAALDLLTPGRLGGYPRSTVVLLRAGLLSEERLYADAVRELGTGVAEDPEEPTLHLVLGGLYERAGLTDLAAGEFRAARDRTGRGR